MDTALHVGLWPTLIFLLLIGSVTAGPLETFLEAPGPKGPLRGTMLAPTGGPGSDVILIIPGSGPTDRDGNNPLGVRASTYRLLADSLAKRGISSVRIDKRGMFESSAATSDVNAVTIADHADDVHSWVSIIMAVTGTHCVWLLGHSEGGLVALAATANQTINVCGLILVSVAGRPLGDIYREQLASNPAYAPVLDEAFMAITALENGRRFETTNMNPTLFPLFGPEVQDFLIEALSYDPSALLAAYRGPNLILQGERDIQISVEDADQLSKANPEAEVVFLPDTNHMLKPVTSPDREANIATYADTYLPLAPGVIEAIERFLTSYQNSRRRFR